MSNSTTGTELILARVDSALDNPNAVTVLANKMGVAGAGKEVLLGLLRRNPVAIAMGALTLVQAIDMGAGFLDDMRHWFDEEPELKSLAHAFSQFLTPPDTVEVNTLSVTSETLHALRDEFGDLAYASAFFGSRENFLRIRRALSIDTGVVQLWLSLRGFR